MSANRSNKALSAQKIATIISAEQNRAKESIVTANNKLSIPVLNLLPLNMYNFNIIFHGNQLYSVPFCENCLNGPDLVFIHFPSHPL